MSQLRSFAAYTNTAPVVPTLTGLIGQTTNFPCSLCNLDGYAAAAGWLQIFDLAATTDLASGSTVPLKSFRVSAAGPLPSIFGVLGPIALNNGLCIAMSSTEAVYTAVGTNFDVFGEIDEWEFDVTVGCTKVESAGYPIGSDDQQVVWNTTNDAQTLTYAKILYPGGAGTNYYMMVIGAISADGTYHALMQKTFITGQTSMVLNFGLQGLSPMLLPSTGGQQIAIAASSTPGFWTPTSSNAFAFQAFYKDYNTLL